MITDLRSVQNKTVGLKESLVALDKKIVEKLYVAQDIDKNVSNQIKSALYEDVEIIYIPKRKQLGESCGIDVGAACVAILKK